MMNMSSYFIATSSSAASSRGSDGEKDARTAKGREDCGKADVEPGLTCLNKILCRVRLKPGDTQGTKGKGNFWPHNFQISADCVPQWRNFSPL